MQVDDTHTESGTSITKWDPQGYVLGIKDVDIFKPPVVDGPRITLFTLSIFRLCSFLLTVCMIFHCVVTRFQYQIFLKLFSRKPFGLNLEAIHNTITWNSGGFQMKLRWISGVLRWFSGGFQRVFRGFSGGFQGDFQWNFRWISEQFQGVLRLFSGGFQYLWIRYSSERIQSIKVL